MPAVSVTDTYDALLTTTAGLRLRQLWDNLSVEIKLLNLIEASKNKKTGLNGHRVEIPLLYGRNSTVDNRGDYDTIPLQQDDGITTGFVSWKNLSGSITISLKQLGMNAGKERYLSLLEAKMKQIEITLRDDLNEDLFSLGTANANQPQGLQYWLRTSTATVASIDDSTNTWWQNQSQTSIGSFASNGRTKFRTLRNDCSLGQGSDTVTDIMTTQVVYEAYEASLDAAERYTLEASGPSALNVGVDVLKFHGARLWWDDDCPSGTAYFLNTRDGKIRWNVLEGFDFKNTPFQTPPDQPVKSSLYLLWANLSFQTRRKQGVATGITA